MKSEEVSFVNFPKSEENRLSELLSSGDRPNSSGPLGEIILWQGSVRKNPTVEEYETVRDTVRAGGGLLLSLPKLPGNAGLRFAPMMPTTSWMSMKPLAYRGGIEGEVSALSWDESFVSLDRPFRLKAHWRLKPFHAVERGKGRYERIEHEIGYVKHPMKPWDSYYTRDIESRDWQVRIVADDFERSGLLITGRYGAGRTAVFAGDIAEMPAPVFKAVMAWLRQGDEQPKGAAKASVAVTSRVDVASRSLAVTLKNEGSTVQELELVARILTWENALYRDELRTVELAANAEKTVLIPISEVDEKSFQALAYRDAYSVRLGVLASNGAEVLSEERIPVDFSPACSLDLALDDIRTLEYPFEAPDYDGQVDIMSRRMGTRISAYAYRPGDTVNIQMMLRNELRNIADLAQADDMTTPANPSISALNDGIVQRDKGPFEKFKGYGAWFGTPGEKNVLRLRFPQKVWLNAITLNGNPEEAKKTGNPDEIRIAIDGEEVASESGLNARFFKEHGLVRIEFPAQMGSEITLTIPWGDKRRKPQLGDIEVWGGLRKPQAAFSGKLRVQVLEGLTDSKDTVLEESLALEAGRLKKVDCSFTAVGDPEKIRFYSVLAECLDEQGQVVESRKVPFMVLEPRHPLRPLRGEKGPRSQLATSLGFIVTKGFRNVFDDGPGTIEHPKGWSSPDDLIWAYSRGLKKVAHKVKNRAEALFITTHDFRYYSTPWTNFLNGERFFDIAPAHLVSRSKEDERWQTSDLVIMHFSDRWGTGPSTKRLYNWQEMLAFDEYLGEQNLPRIQPGTRTEVARQINQNHFGLWQEWQMERYYQACENLYNAFAKEGKKLTISGQGIPMVPYEDQKLISKLVKGMSDDATFGMIEESISQTTGRQMAALALNPVWEMTSLYVWGYDSAVLGNVHWRGVVGTTEPSRRHLADRAWRSMLTPDGQFRSMHTFGYVMNAQCGWTFNGNDYQESFRFQEKHSLIGTDGPLGIGVLVGTSQFDSGPQATFSGGSRESWGSEFPYEIANLIGHLHDAGVSVSFSGNTRSLEKAKVTAPLVILWPEHLRADEIEQVTKLAKKGVPLSLVTSSTELDPELAALFGIDAQGNVTTGTARAKIRGREVVQEGNRLFIAADHGRIKAKEAEQIAELMHEFMKLPIRFPEGVRGYGFRSGDQKFVVAEDWLEKGRTVELRVAADPGKTSATAVECNDHAPLKVTREGDEWVIELPLRPADGVLICIEEGAEQTAAILEPSATGDLAVETGAQLLAGDESTLAFASFHSAAFVSLLLSVWLLISRGRGGLRVVCLGLLICGLLSVVAIAAPERGLKIVVSDDAPESVRAAAQRVLDSVEGHTLLKTFAGDVPAELKSSEQLIAGDPKDRGFHHLILVGLNDDPMVKKAWQREARWTEGGIYAFGYGHIDGQVGYIESDRNPFLHSRHIRRAPYETQLITLTGNSEAGVGRAVTAFLEAQLTYAVLPIGTWTRPRTTLLDADPHQANRIPDTVSRIDDFTLIGRQAGVADEKYGVLEHVGVLPKNIWRYKYHRAGLWEGSQENTFQHYLSGLHRRAYGYSLCVVEFESDEIAEAAAVKMARAAKLKQKRDVWTGRPMVSGERRKGFENSDVKNLSYHLWQDGSRVILSCFPKNTDLSILKKK